MSDKKFNIKKHLEIPEDAVTATIYNECPTCKHSFESYDKYKGNNGEVYPKLGNERKGYTDWGDYHDWDELYYCNNCNHHVYLENGVY